MYRPRRRLMAELLPLVSVGLAVFGSYLISKELFAPLPAKAIPAAAPSFSFVKLKPAELAAALERTRLSWRDAGGTRRLRVNLYGEELPPMEPLETARGINPPHARLRLPVFVPETVAPSLAAPPRAALPPRPAPASSAKPAGEELLTIE